MFWYHINYVNLNDIEGGEVVRNATCSPSQIRKSKSRYTETIYSARQNIKFDADAYSKHTAAVAHFLLFHLQCNMHVQSDL